MKITIDVPDILPANFGRPSLELLRFVKEFQDLCLEISLRYRDITGREFFTAYVRNGWNTVSNTNCPGKWYLIQLPDGSVPGYNYKPGDDKIEESDELQEWQRVVFMEEDHPGDWVVARLCVGNWAYKKKEHRTRYVTLRSSDFDSLAGKQPKAQAIMRRIVRRLVKMAHTVPRSSL